MRWLKKIPPWVLVCFVISPLVTIGSCILMVYDVPYVGWLALAGFIITASATTAVVLFDADPFG